MPPKGVGPYGITTAPSGDIYCVSTKAKPVPS
jgi:streptogramin lyase